ncbi:hypothetical protein CYMTET_52458, partial [Cymbomonas tetramitiformis]
MLLSDAANHYGYPSNQRVMLLHLVESTAFPPYSMMPRAIDGNACSCFDSKAIPYVSMYCSTAFDALWARCMEPLPAVAGVQMSVNGHIGHSPAGASPADVAPEHLLAMSKLFRLFLSHKQSTGRYAVHRIHETLQGSYCMFLDVNAGNLELHNLVMLVQKSHTLAVYLSDGYLQSQFCLLELAVALMTGLHLVWLRDFQYNLPSDLDQPDSSFQRTLRNMLSAHVSVLGVDASRLGERLLRAVRSGHSEAIVYHQELFQPFMKLLTQRVGLTDACLELACEFKPAMSDKHSNAIDAKKDAFRSHSPPLGTTLWNTGDKTLSTAEPASCGDKTLSSAEPASCGDKTLSTAEPASCGDKTLSSAEPASCGDKTLST